MSCRSCLAEKPRATEYIEYNDQNLPVYERITYKDGTVNESFYNGDAIKSRLSELLHKTHKSQEVKAEIQSLYSHLDRYHLAQLEREKLELSPEILFRKRNERDDLYQTQYEPRGISYASFRRNWDDNEGSDSDVGYEEFLPGQKYESPYEDKEYEEYEEEEDYESFLD